MLGLLVLLVLPAAAAGAAPPVTLVAPLGRDITWTSTLAGLSGIQIVQPPPHDAVEVPTRSIRTALTRARRALAAFDLDAARGAVADAAALIRPHSRSIVVLELEREVLTLEVTLAHAGRDARRLEAALSAFAARFPGAPPPPKSGWPPALAERLAAQAAPRSASLSVQTTPAGAELYLDGEAVGTAPRTLTALAAGPHVVEARLDGYRPALERLELTAGTAAPLALVLRLDLAAALAAGTRTPALESELRRLAGDAPVVWAERAGGGVRFVGPHGRATSTSLDRRALAEALRGAQGLAPDPLPPAAASEARPWWPWLAVGSGLASAATGVGLRVWAVTTQDQLTARAGALTQVEAHTIQGDAEARATAGTVLIAAGVAVAVGVGAWLWLDGAAP